MERTETFEEFRRRELNKNVGSKRDFKIKGSWGVYDSYKYIRKNGWYNIGRPLKEGEFYAIIRGINNLLAEEVALGNTITFPANMGRLELRKSKRGVGLVDGKLKITYPIDWAETFKLWYNDEEAHQNKNLMYFENEYVYHVKYLVTGPRARYVNKCFYQFALNSFLKKHLSDNIIAGKIDTLWN